MSKIFYKSGYKFQIASDYTFKLPPEFPESIYSDRFLYVHGDKVTIREGYCSDGASFPAIDTKTFIRGAFVHDALYQLLREGVYSPNYRDAADRYLVKICKEDGMNAIRRWWVYQGLRIGGMKAAMPSSKKKVISAP